jgi:hypothetical protein
MAKQITTGTGTQVEVPENGSELLQALQTNPSNAPGFLAHNRLMIEGTDALVLRNVTPGVPERILVPGILQSADYAEAVIRGYGTDEDRISSSIGARLGRAATVLASGAHCELMMSQATLKPHQYITASILKKQLIHTLEVLKAHPQVSLRLVPAEAIAVLNDLEIILIYPQGAGGAAVGIFNISALPDVQVEPSGVTSLEKLWDKLEAQALTAQESYDQIEAALARLG